MCNGDATKEHLCSLRLTGSFWRRTSQKSFLRPCVADPQEQQRELRWRQRLLSLLQLPESHCQYFALKTAFLPPALRQLKLLMFAKARDAERARRAAPRTAFSEQKKQTKTSRKFADFCSIVFNGSFLRRPLRSRFSLNIHRPFQPPSLRSQPLGDGWKETRDAVGCWIRPPSLPGVFPGPFPEELQSFPFPISTQHEPLKNGEEHSGFLPTAALPPGSIVRR